MLRSPEVAIQHETEPWADLFERGREDERLVHEDSYEPRAARLTLVPPELSPAVTQALKAAGIDQLYSHQSEALYKAFEGPTMITTGTASGKSLCFQLPTLQTLSSDRTARALYLYPPRRSRRTRLGRSTVSACTS